jgi:hypothetical protein
MRLANEAALPGLRVNDVTFAAGTGSGPFDRNGIAGNVSGVYGLRWFACTNGSDPADNPMVNVVLSNADFTCGFVAQQPPQALPNGSDTAVTGIVWADSQASASVLTFNSFKQYDLLVRKNNNGVGNPSVALRTAVVADNPGAQLAQISIYRANPGNQAQIIGQGDSANPFLGYETYLGTYTGTPAQSVIDKVPGRYCTATVFVDQLGLYTVRDTANMYDEDLCDCP